jgi:uncharacterized MAPEG superfamily protein
MTTPVWMLLGFAIWTILLLTATVGVYRWSRILSKRAPISSFRGDKIDGEDWYQRAMRAHANCIENLPVFGAIVLGLHVGKLEGTLVDVLTVVVLGARVVQSLVHVCLVQTDRVVAVRFTFFAAQIACFLGLAVLIVIAQIGGA